MTGATLTFATGNPAKLAQLRWVAAHLGYDLCVVPARERFGAVGHYEELGRTELAIARRGALQVAARIGVPVVTEDTGLHVRALDGQPSIRAGRYLKANGRAGLLRELADAEDRRAAIVSAVAYATPGGICQTYIRVVRGMIIDDERWTPGLPDWIAPAANNPYGGGYNAIFVPDGESRTLAEIPPAEAMVCGYREPNFKALLGSL